MPLIDRQSAQFIQQSPAWKLIDPPAIQKLKEWDNNAPLYKKILKDKDVDEINIRSNRKVFNLSKEDSFSLENAIAQDV